MIDFVPTGLVSVTSRFLLNVKFNFKTSKTCSRCRIPLHTGLIEMLNFLVNVAIPSILKGAQYLQDKAKYASGDL